MNINERTRGGELKTALQEQGAWIGPDLYTKQVTTLKPGSLTFLHVALPDVASVQPFVEDGPYVSRVSTRSVLAQLGTEAIRGSETTIKEAIIEGRKSVNVPFQNHTSREILIKEKTAVLRLTRWNPSLVTGEALEKLVETEITLQGQQGRDWDYFHNPQTNEPEGLLFPLDPNPQYRLWLPPNGNEPIIISPEVIGTAFRPQLDKWLKPIATDDSPKIEITQTIAQLWFPPKIHALINDDIDTSLVQADVGNTKHINCLAIYGGRTGVIGTVKPWPIRVETRPRPDAIVLTFPSPLAA